MLGTAAAKLTAKAQSPVPRATQKKKPNIIRFLADQFRRDL
jgi:hypothetical protein